MNYIELLRTTWNYNCLCSSKNSSPSLFFGVLLLLLLFFKNYIKYIYTYIHVRFFIQSMNDYTACNEGDLVYVVV